MKENRNRTHPTEQNYFDRLPTELIVSIFDRITDAKSLCICYSVCKYFATHVVQTRVVSVEIPYAVGDHEVPIWPPGVINFLKKLCCVESAAIQFCPDPSTSQPLGWWKSDSCGTVYVAESHGIASVKATRKNKRGACLSSITSPLLDFRLRFRYVQELVVLIPNLKHISAEDFMKLRSIVIEEQGIARMKKNKNSYDGGGELCTKLWIARKVKLPFTERVMKNVVLIYDGPMVENLWETNPEYREVAMTLMKKSAHHHITFPSGTQIGCTFADRLYRTLSFLNWFQEWL